jgi:hypothetical protein
LSIPKNISEAMERMNQKAAYPWLKHSLASQRVTWYCNILLVCKKRDSHKGIHVSLGYCHFGKGIAFINIDGYEQIPKFMYIHDVMVTEENGCGDSDWCFCLKCPKNTALLEKNLLCGKPSIRGKLRHFQKFGFYPKDLQNFNQRLENMLLTLNLEKDALSVEDGASVCYKNPIYQIFGNGGTQK